VGSSTARLGLMAAIDEAFGSCNPLFP
jgi:hypothetical protein